MLGRRETRTEKHVAAGQGCSDTSTGNHRKTALTPRSQAITLLLCGTSWPAGTHDHDREGATSGSKS